MKFPLSWLKDFLETDASLEEIATTLTRLGLEVDGVEDQGAALKPFIVGAVTKAEQHPNADRLRVCTIDTGSGSLQVVCGAPNARAGIKVALARPGDVIPSTGEALKAGVIRGVESQGMLCSGKELGLSDDHDGIMELPEDAQPGQRLADVLGASDAVIEINVTPNRADCASVYGVARDLAAAGLGQFKPAEATHVPGAHGPSPRIAIESDAREACPLFIGRAVRGVTNGPSPEWLQQRLRAVGLRPISALVDITNYFCIGYGRPLHVFDMGRLDGDLTVRFARAGEHLAALNGKTYPLKPSYVVIADRGGPVSLGGVMGGDATGCTEITTDVFLEVALFGARNVAATGRDLQVNSDARYRFERGIDPEFARPAVELATKMILDLCGGEAGEIVTAGEPPHWRRELTLRAERVRSLGGVDVSGDEQMAILERLGFKFEGTTIIPPSWRGDIEGEADLVEEVLRVKGYDAIPATPLPRPDGATRPALSPAQKRVGQAKRLLASRGLSETVTFSFMSSAVADRFVKVNDSLKLLNPISAELDAVRPVLLPNLIEAAVRNAARGQRDLGLFEVGPIYLPEGEQMVAAMLRAGSAVPRGWAGGAREVSVYDAKADALALLQHLGAPEGVTITTDAPAWYHPGRSGAIRLGHKALAYFGEIHPRIAVALGANGALAAAEVFLATLPEAKRRGSERPLLTLSPYQAVERDFAFLVPDAVSADAVVKAARGADKALITGIAVFDVYRGKGVEDGYKSIGISVTFQPTGQTMTDAEIETVSKAVVKAATEATGARLRT